MKVFVVLAVTVACATANPQIFLNGLHGLGLTHIAAGPAIAYAAPAVVAPIATQTKYHAQNELGEASYGYSHLGNAHAAVRDAAGNVRGSYAYINPDGKEIRVEYTAGHGGFQVASNALPIAPIDTNRPAVANLISPVPVQDTPEVAAARAAHLVAHQEALARSGRKKRGLIAAAPIALAAPAHTAITYSAIAAPLTIAAHAPVAVVAAPAVREATLTQVVNNPLHAVSYRVD